MILLIEPMIPALRRYARALLHDREAADDLVQDGLERAIGCWHQRRPDGDTRRWLFAIVHNLAINRLRRQTRRGVHGTLDDADEATLAHPPAQEEGLHHRDLLRALSRLPDDQRSVLLLISIEDFSYAEAALVLGIPLGTVMSRLARAREKLRLMWQDGLAAAAPGPHLRRVK